MHDSQKNLIEARAALTALANPEKAKILSGFFKTGKGQYGEGDKFLGIMVPQIRATARQFRVLPLQECEELLHSEFNEMRLMALIILTSHYQKGDDATCQSVFDIYFRSRRHINNWNLVDVSAPQIVGTHLLRRSRAILYDLANSTTLWDRRIAVISTFTFIRNNQFTDTLKLTEQLLKDQQDLMHKACGWMLREVGKRDQTVLETFLRQFQSQMPRTMLRYAIEKFPPELRKRYLRRDAILEKLVKIRTRQAHPLSLK